MSRIVILTGSMRRGGNTDLLAEAFAKGAAQHHQVEILSVADHPVHPCMGCNACMQRQGHTCVQLDAMQEIYPKLQQADVLILASPVYFYGISAQLKAIIDRLHTPMRDTFRIRRTGLLLVGAADLPDLFDAILTEYRLACRFFHLEHVGQVLVRGAKEKGDVQAGDALNEAYALGASIAWEASAEPCQNRNTVIY